MRVLHTSDIHIREFGDNRWVALEEIVKICREDGVDVLVIAGDMFDRDVDGIRLIPEVKGLFGEVDFRVIILPGNHDYRLFQMGHYFGENVIVIDDYKKGYMIGDVMFWGLPFEEDINEEDVLERLYMMNDLMEVERTNILVFHGELITDRFGFGDFGDEGKKRYMPIRKDFFKELNVSYVLAGHFHTNFNTFTLPNGGYFVYPGSPVSITHKEIGKRKVNIFDVGASPREKILSSYYYEKVSIYINPLADIHYRDVIDEGLVGISDKEKCRIILELNGYTDINKGIDEREVFSYIKEKEKNEGYIFEKIDNHLREISYIFASPVFKEFLLLLEEREISEMDKKAILGYVIEAMVGVF